MLNKPHTPKAHAYTLNVIVPLIHWKKGGNEDTWSVHFHVDLVCVKD